MFNILITGSNGQLGSEIKEIFSSYDYIYFFTDKSKLDILNEQQVLTFVVENNINVIINCAAYTAVDKAESDTELANKINNIAVKYLATIAKEKNIKLIHISTDYVFDGNASKPYKEDDIPKPNSVYGRTKLDGELSLLKINPKNSIIIRTSWLYSSFGSNFVKTMLKLGNDKDELNVVSDQIGTPTYARDLAVTILNILPKLHNEKVEIYNYVNEGTISWYDFAVEIMSLVKINCKINSIGTKDYPTAAARPSYSVLDTTKIKKHFAINIPYWRDSLEECLLIIKNDEK